MLKYWQMWGAVSEEPQQQPEAQKGRHKKGEYPTMEKVKNFYNKNQFIIEGGKSGRTFQSYNSTIANISNNGVLTFGEDWDYSKTTLKHLYLFLNNYKNDIQADQYKNIFSKGFEHSKNKKAFLQNLINKKIIKVCL